MRGKGAVEALKSEARRRTPASGEIMLKGANLGIIPGVFTPLLIMHLMRVQDN